jgi:glycerol uptake facilitator-like aquaporin
LSGDSHMHDETAHLAWLNPTLARRIAAEAVGTAFLLTAVVGSGIMAERLAQGNPALALLANAIATGGALYALIFAFAPFSGAQFNPLVTLAAARGGEMRGRAAGPVIAAQMIGAVAGVWVAHLMFDLPVLELAAHRRTGLGQWAGEFVATFGLIATIESGKRHFPASLPGVVAGYITAAYWFTSSTSFANPAVTLARALSDTFAGIAPIDTPAFILAQIAGAVAALALTGWLIGERTAS